MSDIYEQSLELHKQHGGKLEIKSKVALQTREDLSKAYTPGVARVCEEIAKDKTLSKVYTMKKNSVAIVTDGSAILGLGNLGPEAALPVMEGKAILFKEFGGVDAVPICLDTQNTEEIIQTVKRIAPTFGGINLEDISAPRCFEIEDRLKKELDIPVMHDDQHGTAVVVLAGLINALNIKQAGAASVQVVINGAGAAGIAITNLLLQYGFKNIIMCDSKGIIFSGRGDLNETKKEIAGITNAGHKTGGLAEAVSGADIFIGVSVKDVLTPAMVKTMNVHPIIFALANPHSEILYDAAKGAGALVVATGRSDFPNQVNNVLAFPGIFRGALDRNINKITNGMLIAAAEALAGYIKNPAPENILPSALDRGVAAVVASAIK